MSAAEAVRVDGADGVLRVTMCRPEVHNAVDQAIADGLSEAWDRLDEDPGLHVAVLAGEGESFSAGMDVRAFTATGKVPRTARGFAGTVDRPSRKPVIAAIRGACLGGGLELALACDLLVAADDAVLGLPEVGLGLAALGGGLARLPTRIPYHRAMSAALLDERLSSQEARDLGLVTAIAAKEDVDDVAIGLATRLAALPLSAVLATTHVLRAASECVAGRDAEEAAGRMLLATAPKP